MTPKRQRLYIVIAALSLLSASAGLALYGLSDNLVFFYSPKDIAEQGIGPHGAIGSEQIAAWDPDWIVADAPAGEEAAVRRRLLDQPAVAVTTAGRTGQVLVIDHRQFITMSQYASGLTETVAAALYPDGP